MTDADVPSQLCRSFPFTAGQTRTDARDGQGSRPKCLVSCKGDDGAVHAARKCNGTTPQPAELCQKCIAFTFQWIHDASIRAG
jgi:hypothetical protein